MEKIDDKTAFELLKTFSLFEYGLKKIGYRKSGNDDVAEVDWNKWYQTKKGAILISTDQEVLGEVAYVMGSPAKKQIINENGNLDWKVVDVLEADKFKVVKLVQVVKTIRNNLFHGGKYSNDYVSDPARNKKLMTASIRILREVMKLDKNLEDEINDAEASHYS